MKQLLLCSMVFLSVGSQARSVYRVDPWTDGATTAVGFGSVLTICLSIPKLSP